MTIRRPMCVALLTLFLVLPTRAQAGPVTEQLTADLGRLFSVLSDPTLPLGSEARRQAVRSITENLFDWSAIAQRTLDRYWQGRTEVERRQFARLLATLVEAHIAALERYAGAKIQFVRESVDGERATVETRVVGARGRPLSFDYHMIRGERRWLIADVAIDKASLVDNYRAQFQSILRTSSYETLVEKMIRQ
jgi:phospholipid transport system substrate-binding protein